MISFMVLGGPRSGTTWAANWLTTGDTICLHDPLMEHGTQLLQRLTFPGKRMGISCTASLLYPDWVNTQQCPKVILYRNVDDINRSLRQLGLVELTESRHLARMTKIRDAQMFPYESLFSKHGAKDIATFLGVPWDEARHEVLVQMRIEPLFRRVNMGRQALLDLVARIKEAR